MHDRIITKSSKNEIKTKWRYLKWKLYCEANVRIMFGAWWWLWLWWWWLCWRWWNQALEWNLIFIAMKTINDWGTYRLCSACLDHVFASFLNLQQLKWLCLRCVYRLLFGLSHYYQPDPVHYSKPNRFDSSLCVLVRWI